MENMLEAPQPNTVQSGMFDRELIAQYGSPEPRNQRPRQPEPSELVFSSAYGDDKPNEACGGTVDVPSLLATAEDSLGQKVWKDSDYSQFVEGGRLSAAASVSEILQRSGFSCAGSASVIQLADQLSASQAWKPAGGVDSAQAGDIIYGSDNAKNNIGIVGKDGNGKLVVYMGDVNSERLESESETGSWTKVPIETFASSFPQDTIHVLRPTA